VKTAFDISKKHIEDFRKGIFITHKNEKKVPMITLTHKYFMEILEESERFRKQAYQRGKKK
jgi:chemotaxis methyl-accepting protein methylase